MSDRPLVGPPLDPEVLTAVWQHLLDHSPKSWAVFAHGTCVLLAEPKGGDLGEQASAFLADQGPVYPGTDRADFDVLELVDEPGWLVTSHLSDLMTYVAPSEVREEEPNDVLVGITGRTKRDFDAKELRLVHVEDKRGPKADEP